MKNNIEAIEQLFSRFFFSNNNSDDVVKGGDVNVRYSANIRRTRIFQTIYV